MELFGDISKFLKDVLPLDKFSDIRIDFLTLFVQQ